MVSNMSGDLKVADVFLDFGGKQHPSAPLVFNPHETKVLSIPQLLADINASVSEAPEGGITVIQRGAHPALIAQGKVTDSATGFSTTLEFPDPARQHASAVHASGIPIGTPTKDSPFRGALHRPAPIPLPGGRARRPVRSRPGIRRSAQAGCATWTLRQAA